jgi:glutamate-5-semialdehyde dehydrogenase
MVIARPTPRLQAKVYDRMVGATDRARAALLESAGLDASARGAALSAAADALVTRADELLSANAADLSTASAELGAGARDRLRLTEETLARMAEGLRALAASPDPLGDLDSRSDDGVRLARRRVPVGVVAVVFEARPAGVARIIGTALRAGNAVLLRGAPAGEGTHVVLTAIFRDALAHARLPRDLLQQLPSSERSTVRHLVTANGQVDLVLVGGGPLMVKSALSDSTVPSMSLSSGNSHVYVDAAADLELALDVVLRSKADPSALNAVEAVLVHEAVAAEFVPRLAAALSEAGVRVHGDEQVCELVPGAAAADAEGWRNGYRCAELAVGVTPSLAEVIAFVEHYGLGHTEVVVTEDPAVAAEFAARVDTAVVGTNVPTTVFDGAAVDGDRPFGTRKLPARGPIEPADLTVTRWVAGRE